MNRLWMSFVIVVWFSCLLTPIIGIAGPFDQLKNLKLDPKVVQQPKAVGHGFQFANFKLNPDTGDPSRVWMVDLKVGPSISVNEYVVKTLFQDRRGETLFSGADIPLPAGNAGKTYPLTRPFQKEPIAARIVFQVYHQGQGRVVASQTYPLAAVVSYGMQGAETSAKPSAPQRTPVSPVEISGNLDVSFAFDPIRQGEHEYQSLRIQNKGSIPLRMEGISVKAKFLVGIDNDMWIRCNSREIRPGQEVICEYNFSAGDCPTLTRLEVEARLNGLPYRGELKFDSPINEIRNDGPVIRLTKHKEMPSREGHGGGKAEVIVRGAHVRLGSTVTLRALASVDSDRFPVVFSGTQQDDGIHAGVEILGARYLTKPDKFCFHLTEIRTCEDLRCGGVGVLLWENAFNWSAEHNSHIQNYNLFLVNNVNNQCQ